MVLVLKRIHCRIHIWLYHRRVDTMKKNEIVIVWKGNKLPCEDCDIIFKDKFNKEHKVELSRLIRVFNNNIWQHKKSVKCNGINYINTQKVKGNYLKEIGTMMLMTKNYQVLQRYYKRLKMLRKLKASRGGLKRLAKLRQGESWSKQQSVAQLCTRIWKRISKVVRF